MAYAFFMRFFLIGLLVASAPAAAGCPALLDRSMPTILEQPQSLCEYAGKVVLVVNTASQCGYTPQYEGLEALYRKYKRQGLVVLGFPSNDFGGQEPGSNREIAAFCVNQYAVDFPMFAKIAVSGKAAHPFYADLAKAAGSAPRWNFHKYLVDRSGGKVMSFNTQIEPGDPKFVAAIERALHNPQPEEKP
jgi:glutathione peroxidase